MYHLRDNITIWENLLQSIDTMVIIMESDSDKIIFVNESMKKEFGFTDSVLGKRCWEVLGKSSEGRCYFCPKYSLNTGSDETVLWEFPSPQNSKHYRIKSKFLDWPDGSRVFFEQIDDITELKDSIKNRLDADERSQLMLNSSPLGIMLINRNFKTIDYNLEAEKIFGIDNKNLSIEMFFDMSPEYQPDGGLSKDAKQKYLEQMFEDTYGQFEWMHQKKNGELVPCEVTFVQTRYKGEDVVITHMRDISEHYAFLEDIEKANEKLRMARDAAESANEAKSAFLANMSHEIRTPMNSIIGFSELALDDNISPKTRDYLSRICESAEWLLSIVNDILDISKIESGKMELENIPFDLYDIFSHCRAAILPKAEEKGISLYCYAESTADKKLSGDSVRLRQVLMNMLSNAVKFTESGTVELLASVADFGDKNVKIHFEVKDTGIGISDEQIEKIFDPFMQADNSITRKFGGTGLGLAISKNIIELMGGKLEVKSAQGVGSIFSFDIVFDAVDDLNEEPQKDISFNEFEKPIFDGEILVCEDNSMNQQVISEHLSRVGVKTVLAENGKQGADIIAKRLVNGEKLFDLIFMDIHMPVMDGFEASSLIAKMGVETPIVTMTANLMPGEIEKYRQSGMSEFLGKPFTSHNLWKCLLKYLPLKGVSSVGEKSKITEDEKLQRQLMLNFVKSNQTTFYDIKKAIEDGDIKLAHRLCHTLKSNAAQIGEAALSKAAADAEVVLSVGLKSGSSSLLSEKQYETLESELKASLLKFAPLLELHNKIIQSSGNQLQDKKKIDGIFGQLEEMLENSNPLSMNLLDGIRTIPGTEKLAQHIEDFEFKRALDALLSLKRKMGLL